MSEFRIVCPYCFAQIRDDEVHFRSEYVSPADPELLPAGEEAAETERETAREKLARWEFFTAGSDKVYEEFWECFGGTTECAAEYGRRSIIPYKRRVIDPADPEHRKYLTVQSDGGYLTRDAAGMVNGIELNFGHPVERRCSRRVCPRCHNPLPEGYGRFRPVFVPVIGSAGAGKTLFLSRLLRNIENYAAGVGLSACLPGPAGYELMKNDPLGEGSTLPAATAAERYGQPLIVQFTRRLRSGALKGLTLVTYDIAGEALADRGLLDIYAPCIRHADGAILLKDMLRESGPGFEAQLMSILTGDSESGTALPIAICCSKVCSPAMQQLLGEGLSAQLRMKPWSGKDEPAFDVGSYWMTEKKLLELIRLTEPALYTRMKNLCTEYAVFAVDSLGCGPDAGSYPGEDTVPVRIEQPLYWLLSEFGLIGRSDIRCPACKSTDTEAIPVRHVPVRIKGMLGRGKLSAELDRRCNLCGYEWEK